MQISWYLAKTDCYRKGVPSKTSHFFPLPHIMCTPDSVFLFAAVKSCSTSCLNIHIHDMCYLQCVFWLICADIWVLLRDRLCLSICFLFSSPLFSALFLPLVPLRLSFIMGRGRLEIKEASREIEWAVTLCDAICYPQRIASGRLTCSIHLSTLALIKQMPVDI